MSTRLIAFTGLAIGAPLLIAVDKVMYAEPHVSHDGDEPSFDGTVLTIADGDNTAQVLVAERIDDVADKLGAFSQIPSVREAMDAWTPEKLDRRIRERHADVVAARNGAASANGESRASNG